MTDTSTSQVQTSTCDTLDGWDLIFDVICGCESSWELKEGVDSSNKLEIIKTRCKTWINFLYKFLVSCPGSDSAQIKPHLSHWNL